MYLCKLFLASSFQLEQEHCSHYGQSEIQRCCPKLRYFSKIKKKDLCTLFLASSFQLGQEQPLWTEWNTSQLWRQPAPPAGRQTKSLCRESQTMQEKDKKWKWSRNQLRKWKWNKSQLWRQPAPPAGRQTKVSLGEAKLFKKKTDSESETEANWITPTIIMCRQVDQNWLQGKPKYEGKRAEWNWNRLSSHGVTLKCPEGLRMDYPKKCQPIVLSKVCCHTQEVFKLIRWVVQ